MGLAEADQPGGGGGSEGGGVAGGDLALQQHRTGLGDLAGDIVIVLPADRHPIQRAQPDHAARVIRAALDAGINYFDCARGYGTEEKVGAGIRGRRDQCVLASKSGSRDAQGILSDIEASLKALGTDYLDAYKCHGVITPELLGSDAVGLQQSRQAQSGSFKFTVLQAERELLQQALQKARGNKSAAARSLGMKLSTFRDKLAKHNLA